jgi:hypothetical protein
MIDGVMPTRRSTKADGPIKQMYTVRLDPALRDRMKALKARDGVPESEQIRRALDAFLSAKGLPGKGGAKQAAIVSV